MALLFSNHCFLNRILDKCITFQSPSIIKQLKLSFSLSPSWILAQEKRTEEHKMIFLPFSTPFSTHHSLVPLPLQTLMDLRVGGKMGGKKKNSSLFT